MSWLGGRESASLFLGSPMESDISQLTGPMHALTVLRWFAPVCFELRLFALGRRHDGTRNGTRIESSECTPPPRHLKTLRQKK